MDSGYIPIWLRRNLVLSKSKSGEQQFCLGKPYLGFK